MNEETLFHAALARSKSDRQSFLNEACEGQPELLAAVEALLSAHELEETLLGGAGSDPGATVSYDPDSTLPAEAAWPPRRPLVAGRYALVKKLGEGGMGEVWIAEQSEPIKRTVALKLIKSGLDSKGVLARFEQERQALAIMDHPNIARVFDGGVTPDGEPFFVMELVKGMTLGNYCDENQLTPKERLELFVPICQAVQHAHQKGIVHRDLKPANILVTVVDGRPVPKVIDFGVAKAVSGKILEDTMATQHGAVVGTIEYMAPEQAGYSGVDIDTRADVYSLGVIFYELLTGLRPFDSMRLRSAALLEKIRIIQEEEPPTPSLRLSHHESLSTYSSCRKTEPKRLLKLLRGDLDWIAMKCLEKNRTRRYETANGLARDIQRYLAGDPVEARPPSVGYKLGKFARRHKFALATTLAFAILLIGATITSFGLSLWALDERSKSQFAESVATTQKTRAEDREKQAIEAVKRFREAVVNNPELFNSPQLEQLRKSLLKEPIVFFKSLREELLADAGTTNESLFLLAGANYELGDLASDVGDDLDSLNSYREALAILQQLAEREPQDPQYRRQISKAYHNMSIQFKKVGQPTEALDAIQSALAIHKELVDEDPRSRDLLRELANIYHSLAKYQHWTNQFDEAMKTHETELDVVTRLLDADPNDHGIRYSLAILHGSIGNVWSDMGEKEKANKSYESARNELRKLVKQHPKSWRYKLDLARNEHNLAILLSENQQFEEALKILVGVRAIRQEIVLANPSITVYQQSLADVHNNIGSMLREMNKPADAARSHGRALVILAKLVKDHPESSDIASELASTLNNLALIDMKANKFDAAKARLTQALEWQRKAVAANPNHPYYRREFNYTLMNMTLCCTALGDAQGALAASREMLGVDGKDAPPPAPQPSQ